MNMLFEIIVIFLLAAICILLFIILKYIKEGLTFTKTIIKVDKDKVTKEETPWLRFIERHLDKINARNHHIEEHLNVIRNKTK